MTKQGESKLSSNIMKELRKRGAFCFKVHGSVTMMAGLPDIICCYKGHFIGFETKMPAKKDNVSAAQARVHELIRQAGGKAVVVWSVPMAVKELQAIDQATLALVEAIASSHRR